MFFSGSYTATWDGNALGVIEAGFTLSATHRAERIESDITGAMFRDGVFRGIDMTIDFVLSEWDAAAAEALWWPYSATLGQTGEIGRTLVGDSMAKVLVLTACKTGITPATLTFHKTLLDPDFDVSILFANNHRKIPIRQRIFPVGTGTGTALQSCGEHKLFTAA